MFFFKIEGFPRYGAFSAQTRKSGKNQDILVILPMSICALMNILFLCYWVTLLGSSNQMFLNTPFPQTLFMVISDILFLI
jgi:hypothetical protein